MKMTPLNGDQIFSFRSSARSRSKVEVLGFDINQPNHVRLVQKALGNCNGGTIQLKLGRYARDD